MTWVPKRIEGQSEGDYQKRVEEFNKYDRRRKLKNGLAFAGVFITGVIVNSYRNNIINFADNVFESLNPSKQELALTQAEAAELYGKLDVQSTQIAELQSGNAGLESQINDFIDTYSEKDATTPEATQETLLNTTNYSPELDVVISGVLLRKFPDRYSSIIELLNQKTGFDWELRDCGDNCHTLEDIDKIEFFDSDEHNLVKITLYDCDVCDEEPVPYDFELSEERMNEFTKDYHQETFFADNFLLGAILGKLDHGYEGLVGLFAAADTGLEYDRLSELVKDAERVVFVPNSYCGDNTDDPMIIIIPSMDEDANEANAFRVPETLYGSIVEYVAGLRGDQ